MDTAITLHLKPSRQLVLFYLLLLMISLAGISVLPVALWMKWSLAIVVMVLIMMVLRHHALLLSPNSIVKLSYQPALEERQRWQITTKAGKTEMIRLKRTACYVSPYLTVLSFQTVGHPSWLTRLFQPSLILLPDRIAKDDFRRLRLLLNWGDLTIE